MRFFAALGLRRSSRDGGVSLPSNNRMNLPALRAARYSGRSTPEAPGKTQGISSKIVYPQGKDRCLA